MVPTILVLVIRHTTLTTPCVQYNHNTMCVLTVSQCVQCYYNHLQNDSARYGALALCGILVKNRIIAIPSYEIMHEFSFPNCHSF